MAKPKHTSPTSSTKHIRIGTAYYPSIDGSPNRPVRAVPYIRLRGTWLVDAGFSPGDMVTIRATRGRLAIARA